MSADEPLRVVVWRVGDATLAAPLDRVIEIAAVSDGRVRSRAGDLDLTALRGLQADPVGRAVVLRTARGPVALPAAEVEGVIAARPRSVRETPAWLAAVGGRHVDRLIRLEDDRVAVLLAVEGAGSDA